MRKGRGWVAQPESPYRICQILYSSWSWQDIQEGEQRYFRVIKRDSADFEEDSGYVVTLVNWIWYTWKPNFGCVGKTLLFLWRALVLNPKTNRQTKTMGFTRFYVCLQVSVDIFTHKTGILPLINYRTSTTASRKNISMDTCIWETTRVQYSYNCSVAMRAV